MKIIFYCLIFVLTLQAKEFHFTETRYSDAFQSSQQLQGVINFTPDALEISYKDYPFTLMYAQGVFTLLQAGEIQELQEQEEQKMSQFMELIYLLYTSDTQTLKKDFSIKTKDQKMILTPQNYLSQFIQNIVLHKNSENQEIVQLHFVLKNSDTITIDIHDQTL